MALKPKDLVGLTIFACLGHKPDKRRKDAPLDIILFSDRETYIKLEEQDYYSYHDCSSCAREITACRDAEAWDRYLKSEDYVASTLEPGVWY